MRKTLLAAPLIAILFTLLAGYTYVLQAAGPVEAPEFIGSKTIEEEVCSVAVDLAKRRLKPGILCAANDCRGGMVELKRNSPVIEHSNVSENDCIKKLDATMDTACVNKNQPGNCSGNCPPGPRQECKNAGTALGISTKKIGNLWVCASSRAMCACKCR
jgi:hypothetical protein